MKKTCLSEPAALIVVKYPKVGPKMDARKNNNYYLEIKLCNPYQYFSTLQMYYFVRVSCLNGKFF